jgi:hypothetical protein
MSGYLTPAPTPPHALSTTPLRTIPAQALASGHLYITTVFPGHNTVLVIWSGAWVSML